MKVFNLYSEYYDLIYRDKDYESEVNYVSDFINKYASETRNILDVGCGTGIHANLLAEKGFKVDGIDLSEGMLKKARKNFPQLNFYKEDARSLNLQKKYDAVVSLFHVASYQNSNIDLNNYFKSIHEHLAFSGIFIFDFWYGPAVLHDKPTVRVKRLENDRIALTRIAEPEMHFNKNTVDVNYDGFIMNKATGSYEKFKETHTMRYLFIPELKFYLKSNGFELVECFKWLSMEKPSEQSWNVCALARSVK